MTQKPYRIKYAGSHGGGVVVTLPFDPRKGICMACGKSKERGEIKVTALHHWWYAHQPKTVKENPILALENTSELCFYCHELADAIRALIYANPKRITQVVELLDGERRERFVIIVCKVVEAMKITERVINPLAKKLLEMGNGNGKSNS